MKPVMLLLLLLPLCLRGQSRLGGWRSHASFVPVIHVAETSEAIAATTSNGILFVDRKDSHLTVKTKVEGLSDTGISAIGTNPGNNLLVVGYENGNVDFIRDDLVTNLPDLTRKSGLADKTIHRIVCEGNYAYLCCAFGIVKTDLQRMEVSETWYLGPSNDLPEIFDLVTFQGSWWAATSRGIYTCDKLTGNLQDFRNWRLQSSLPDPGARFSSFALAAGLMYVHDKSNDRILRFDGTIWDQRYPEIRNIRKITAMPTGFIILTDKEIWLKDAAGKSLISNYGSGNPPNSIAPADILMSASGNLWIGDSRFGLTHRTGTSAFQHLLPDSPGSDQVSALRAGPASMFAATVTTGSAGIPEAGVSIFDAGTWQNFTAADDPGLKSIRPLTSFAFRQNSTDEYWASSAGSGLLFFQKNRVSASYNEQNSSLGSSSGSCLVSGLALDQNNALWYTNPSGKVQLGTRTQGGNFVALPYPGMSFATYSAGDIISTTSGICWVAIPEEGLFAFRMKGTVENISDDQYRKIAVKSRFSNATTTLISSFTGISALAEDHNGQLWVGTNTGIVAYNNPDQVFEAGEFYGSQPSLANAESLFQPILEKEHVTSIAVDGGNRKWVGTLHSGAFLFTENGDHLLHHFDSANSPLPSDQINYIAILPQTGEVFFATDKGMVSYKNDATTGSTDFDKAYV